MPFTDGKVVVEEISDERWALVEPVTYEGNTETFVVPAGFETDFASVPRVVRVAPAAVRQVHEGGHPPRLAVRACPRGNVRPRRRRRAVPRSCVSSGCRSCVGG